MIGWLLGDVWPYLIAAVGAIGGLFFYGRGQRKQGREDAENERVRADWKEARETRERLSENSKPVDADDADERLREQGRLRD